MNKFCTLLILILVGCSSSSENALSINALFSDNMIVQQNAKLNIWGKAPQGSLIHVSSSWGEEASTTTTPDGKWILTIATPEVDHKPHQLMVYSKNETIKIQNILLGEVWLASGQSNMEMPLKGFNYTQIKENVEGAAQEMSEANYPKIRMFKVNRNIAFEQQDRLEGQWIESFPETVKSFSAVGYFFAKKLHLELDVPIGIIHSSWGGSPAESWTRLDYLKRLDDFQNTAEKLRIALDPNTAYNRWLADHESVLWDSLIEVDNMKWTKPTHKRFILSGFDDNNWEAMNQTQVTQVFEKNDFNGVVWLRQQINFDTLSDKNLVLDIGKTDDLYAVFLNGKQLARKEHWGLASSRYTIPKSIIKKGQNTIAIRFIDVWGRGGFDIDPNRGIYLDNKKIKSFGDQWRLKAIAYLTNGDFYLLNEGLKEIVYPNPKRMPHHPNSPTVLYNGMIAPLVSYAIRGVIWYQGESNVSRAKQYTYLFPALIDSWRDAWKNPKMPFYYVQIAPFGGGSWGVDSEKTQTGPELRESQMLTLTKNDVGMAIITDLGDEKLIHPPKKKEVGERLAFWALSKNYGYSDLVYSGPVFKSVKFINDKALVSFNYTGSGLFCKDSKIKHFELAGSDGNYYPAQATILGDKVQVWSKKVPAPIKIRYAWKNFVHVNLFNKEGLPASSFRSEN
jgi:sialate O-acetylesterase